MHELRSNASLRIAAIAFAIFVIVGTIAIFVFPDDEPAPSDTSSGVPPTVSIANQTRIAAFNATALAGTPTPQDGSRAPSQPASETRSGASYRIFIGSAPVDRTLNLLESGGHDELLKEVGFAVLPCGDSQAADPAPCNGSPTGTTIPFFVAIGCNPEFVTDNEQAHQVVLRALGRHAAWDIYAVIRGSPPGVTNNGYAVALRAATGNVGDIWYLNPDGRIVGVNSACAPHPWSQRLPIDPSRPDAAYVYGPCMGACGTPTPQP